MAGNEFKGKPIRLLYLPNEISTISHQVGPRAAFNEMVVDQTLSDYQVFSFLDEANKVGETSSWEKRLVYLAKDMQPNVIFWQHIGNLPLSTDLINQLKGLSSKPLLVYHEGDVYGRFRKRITPSMKILAKHSDITFLVGLGENAELFKNAGARNIKFSPHSVDTIRFGHDWNQNTQGRSGVVMIANHIISKPFIQQVPPLRLPGILEREQFALKLHNHFGDRFKLYGRGWEKYPFSSGIVPYDEQEIVLRQHLVSVNWDHFPNTPFYFSDRLPISLISGVAHTTNYHPGYELLFKNGEQLIYYQTINGAVDIIDWMLCQPDKYLIDMGHAGEQFARNNLTANIVYKQMIRIIKNEMLNNSLYQ
jgi:hypothetical protein